MTDDRLLTPANVMAILGCCRSFLTEHGASMGATKLGRLWRVRQSDLDAWVARGRKAPAPVKQPAPTPLRQARPAGSLNPVTKRPYAASAAGVQR